MDSAAVQCLAFFQQNTDITGIGVRLALYFQLVIFVIQANLRPEDALDALWALSCLNCGLMVAAVVLAVNNSLTFFNALLVQHLVCLTNTALVRVSIALWDSLAAKKGLKASNEPPKPWPVKDKVSILFWALQLFLTLGLMITLWVFGESFGPHSSCIQSLDFYVMFWRVPGSNPFRTAEIANFVIYIGLFLLPVTRIPEYMAHRTHELLLSPLRRLRNTHQADVEKGDGDVLEVEDKHSTFVNCMEHSVGWCLAACFYIPPIELSLRQSSRGADDSGVWTFGQILALIVVLPPLVALIFSIFDVRAEEREEGVGDARVDDDTFKRPQAPGNFRREESERTLYPSADAYEYDTDDKKSMADVSVSAIQTELRQ